MHALRAITWWEWLALGWSYCLVYVVYQFVHAPHETELWPK